MPPNPRPALAGLTREATTKRWPAVLLAACGLALFTNCSTAPVKPSEPPRSSTTVAPSSVLGSTEPAAGVASKAGQGSSDSSGLTEAEVRKLDPKTYAARFRRPIFCEQAARALMAYSPAKAWDTLVACADKGDFKLLERLLEPPWLDALRSRPDAPQLIVKVIAARGGNDAQDGALLRAHKVALFAIGAAVAQPGVFSGQLVLLRASVAEPHMQSAEATLRLLAKGFSRPNEIHLLGRLPRPDPALEPGRELVFIARFETLEERPGESGRPGEWVAVLSLISFAEPPGVVID